jgi:small ligand-binding sensory domain FIST
VKFAGCASVSEDGARAASQACDQVFDALQAAPDLALMFLSPHHVEQAVEVTRILRQRLGDVPLLGVSAQGVIAGGAEIERSPAVSILAASLPGVRLSVFSDDDLPVVESATEAEEQWTPRMGLAADSRAVLLLADPTSVPMMTLLPWFNAAANKAGAGGPGHVQVVGGMASASTKPGANVVILNDRVRRHGLVGVTISGKIQVDTVLSQGCKPFGPTMVVTKSHRNLIFELGGKPALEAMQEVVGELSDKDRESLQQGMFVGMVIDEHKPRFGRNDFLMRAVLGADPQRKAVAVADFPKVGQTVRLHMRDARTAEEDLALLMDAQKLYDSPVGSLLITCNGRGERMFGHPHHDASAVERAFAPQRGETRSAAGKIVEPANDAAIPQAGFFAAGEVGPIGGKSFLHGHTACCVLFREG